METLRGNQTNPRFNSFNPMMESTNPPISAIQRPMVQHNHERLDELNSRLSQRLYPDYEIPASFDPRPIETKYTVLGKTTDPCTTNEVSIKDVSSANSSIEKNFIPATRRGDPNWFLANIDTETILRNQVFPLQKGGVAPQATYIPDSRSELYNNIMPTNSNYVEQPYPLLFEITKFAQNRRQPADGAIDDRNSYIKQNKLSPAFKSLSARATNNSKLFYINTRSK